MEKIQILIKECILKQALKISLQANKLPSMFGPEDQLIEHDISEAFSNEDLTLFVSLFIGEITPQDRIKQIIDWEIPNFGIIKIVVVKEETISLTLYMPIGESVFKKEINLSDFDLSLSPTCQEELNKIKEAPSSKSTPSTPSIPNLSKTTSDSSLDVELNTVPEHNIPTPPSIKPIQKEQQKTGIAVEQKNDSTQGESLDIDFSFTPNPVPESDASNSSDPVPSVANESQGLDIDFNLNSDSSQPSSEDITSSSQEPELTEQNDNQDISKELMDISSVLNSSNQQDTKEEDEEIPPVETPSDLNMDDLFSSTPAPNTEASKSSSKVSKKSESSNSSDSSTSSSNTELNLDSLFNGSESNESKEDTPVTQPPVLQSQPPQKVVDFKDSHLSTIESVEKDLGSKDFILEILSRLDKYQVAYLYPDSIVTYKNEKGLEKLGCILTESQYTSFSRKLIPVNEEFGIYSYADNYYLKSNLSSGIAVLKLKTTVSPSTIFDQSLLSSFLSYSSGIIFSRGDYSDVNAKDVFINFVNENSSKFILDFESSCSFFHRNQTSLVELVKNNGEIEKIEYKVNSNIVDIACLYVPLLDEKSLFSLLKLASKTLLLVHTSYPSKTKLLAQIKTIVEQAPYLEDSFSSEFVGIISLGNKNEIDCIKQSKTKIRKAS